MLVIWSLSRIRLLRLDGLSPARLLCPWDFTGKNTGVGCHFLLQGIFPAQESNPGLLHCRQILYRLRYGYCFFLEMLGEAIFFFKLNKKLNHGSNIHVPGIHARFSVLFHSPQSMGYVPSFPFYRT